MGFVTCVSFVVSKGGFQTQSAACQRTVIPQLRALVSFPDQAW